MLNPLLLSLTKWGVHQLVLSTLIPRQRGPWIDRLRLLCTGHTRLKGVFRRLVPLDVSRNRGFKGVTDHLCLWMSRVTEEYSSTVNPRSPLTWNRPLMLMSFLIPRQRGSWIDSGRVFLCYVRHPKAQVVHYTLESCYGRCPTAEVVRYALESSVTGDVQRHKWSVTPLSLVCPVHRSRKRSIHGPR